MKNALLAACATIALAATGSAALAQTPTTNPITNSCLGGAPGAACVYGGGSTLASVVYGDTQNNETLNFDESTGFVYSGGGSGNGRTGFLTNSPSALQLGAPYPALTSVIHYGASDAVISDAQITAFNTTQGAGHVIQIPSFGTTIAIPFNIAGASNNGAIQLTDDQLCGLFSGNASTFDALVTAPYQSNADTKIPAGLLTIANGGTAGAAVPINVVYRSDSSGTTALLTNHLALVCNTTNAPLTGTFKGFAYTAPATPAGTANQGTFTNFFSGALPSTFKPGNGSGGVQAAVNTNANSIGYVSPDFTRIAPVNNGSSSFPSVAAIKGVNNTTYVLPTSANGSSALNAGPQLVRNVAITYRAPTIAQLQDPAYYVAQVPNPTSGYPIVGFTDLLFAQCYRDSGVAAGVFTYLNNFYTAVDLQQSVVQNGFSPVPTQIRNLITNNILANRNGANVDLGNAATGSATAPGCGGVTGR